MFPLILVICGCLIKANCNIHSKHVSKPTPRPIFSPDWNDLDQRRLPQWYHQAKIGILVHWGVYSVAAYGPRSAPNTKYLSKYWMEGNQDITSFLRAKYGKVMSYEDMGREFKASKFDPDEWAELFKEAGARYVILTSKDGDGFSLFPSEYSPGWNAKDIGPKKDLVALLKKSAQGQGLEFGVYYYLFEWFDPDYIKNIETKVVQTDFNRKVGKFNSILNPYYFQRIRPELERLVKDYEPKILWADGEDTVLSNYWQATDFLAWLYNECLVGTNIVVNDRIENGTRYLHGDFFTYTAFNESVRSETVNQTKHFNPRKLKSTKWEHLIPLDKLSMGYRKVQPGNIQFISSRELIETVVTTVSCGGNVLINIGASSDGRFPTKAKKPLKNLGKWLEVNGEAIYETTPWRSQNETNGLIWYTCRTDKYSGLYPLYIPFQPDVTALYAIFFQWPFDNVLLLKQLTNRDSVHNMKVLGNPGKVEWHSTSNATNIFLPAKKEADYAWALKITFAPDVRNETETDYEDQNKFKRSLL